MSATPQEIRAAISGAKSRQSESEPRGVCTLSFVAGDVSGEGMTEEACASAARLTRAAKLTWVEEKTIPGGDMGHGNRA